MSKVLAIVYRAIQTHPINKVGLTRAKGHTGAVTLIQRFGSALNLNVHFHMLCLDGVYVPIQGGVCFRRVKPSSAAELDALIHSSRGHKNQVLSNDCVLVNPRDPFG